jgi:isopropylmalate/homocitrate/citramalate synthase
MSVPPSEDVRTHIRHLEDLGYKIIEVSPPLSSYGPPQNPQTPRESAVG